jgi:L-2-hydroxyglutarate oxidase LhgO
MDGNVKFGPDAEYVSNPTELAIDERRGSEIVDSMYEAIRRFIPSIDKSLMFPDFSGMRPKLSTAEEPARDFVIERCGPRLVALVGIESPGLTASTAIADAVTRLLYGGDALRTSPSPWAA